MALNIRDYLPVLSPDTVRPILLDPHPDLGEPLSEVGRIDSAVLQDMASLFLRLEKCGDVAIAVAANQIGVRTKGFVMNMGIEPFKPYQDKLGNGMVGFINPRVKTYHGSMEIFDRVNRDKKRGEGCLSLPGLKLITKRHTRITAQWLDLAGNPQELELEGLAAVCFQHEADHTEGIMCWTRMPTEEGFNARYDWREIKKKLEDNPPEYSYTNYKPDHEIIFGDILHEPEKLFGPTSIDFEKGGLFKKGKL